uniref:Sesquipedalian n=1 Tax=Corvus moneduloides TaxID=1196302 RepID=A0A8U7N1V5_CORMO
MKLNERSVAHYATCDSPADHAGFLRKRVERHHHHAHHHGASYQRRWFVLKGNLLFYFEERESREPVGLVVLEGCTVELCEAAEEFAFAIRFDDAGARAYVLVADGQAAMEAWVKALSRASFDYMRLVVRELENGGCVAGSPAPSLSPTMLESPVSPETICFSKLHNWYGQEIAVLRREWQERQKRGHPLCSDHSPCKVPYRAPSARRAACPRGRAEAHSCTASLSVVALPSSWQRCTVGGEALQEREEERAGLRRKSKGVGVSYGCWQCLGLPLQRQSHTAVFYQACTWPASTSL